MPLSVIFYCGARSPFGLAHLEPLLRQPQLRVEAVVIATEETWRAFRERLTGTRVSHLSRALEFLALARRGFSEQPDEVARRCCAVAGIPLWREADVNAPEALTRVRDRRPDVIISAAYPQIFGSELLNSARHVLNSHPSLLPRYRGAHPIFWALAKGESRTGISIHYMTAKLDAGDVLVQLPVPISDRDTYELLYGSITERIPAIVDQLGAALAAAQKPVPQDQSKASFFREDKDADHRISFASQTAEEIHNLVRAANGRAFLEHAGRRWPVTGCTLSREPGAGSEAGEVLAANRRQLEVRAKEGAVSLTVASSRLRMPLRIRTGEILR